MMIVNMNLFGIASGISRKPKVGILKIIQITTREKLFST
jgi:hypothetical protein